MSIDPAKVVIVGSFVWITLLFLVSFVYKKISRDPLV